MQSQAKKDSGRRSSRILARTSKCATSPSDRKPATSPIIMKLCKLAVSMLFHLDPVKSSHKAILEGWLFPLGDSSGGGTQGLLPLERGRSGSKKSIRHRGTARIPEKGDESNLPIAATDAEASEAQAPYLIWMLSRTMGLSTSMSFANKPITSSGRRSGTARQDISRGALYADAHIRLQHTLVRAVFGERLAAKFEPALEPPLISSGDDDLWTDLDPQIETVDVGDWFKDEVWRLVGWDVLRGNITWD